MADGIECNVMECNVMECMEQDVKIRMERHDGSDMNNALRAECRPIVYQAKTHCVRGKDTQCAEQHNRNEPLNPSRFVISYICDAI